jgi:hypothetical protein
VTRILLRVQRVIPLPEHQRSGQTRAVVLVRSAAWLIGLAIAAAQAVVYRVWINMDSISYLDMSDGVITGELSRLVNTTWSPMYPALVGVVRLFHPAPDWDLPALHLVNFLSFVFAFACFEYLQRSVLALVPQASDDEHPAWAPWMYHAVGYALFLWASLGMLTLMKPTPDMLMSGFLYLTAAVLFRIWRGEDNARTWIMLGALIGLGYLAKAFMFPLGLVMIAMTLLFRGSLSTRVTRAVVAAVVVAVVAGPFMIGVSKRAHHPTFSEAARVVHLAYIDGAGPTPFWERLGDATGKLVYPPNKIFTALPAWSYETQPGITRAAWFDPGHLTEGLKPAFKPRKQLGVVLNNLRVYGGVALRMAGVIAVVLLFGFLAGGPRTLAALRWSWPLWLVGVVALGAYSTIWVEERYIGGFIAIIWLGFLASVRLPRRVSPLLVNGAFALVVLNLAGYTLSQMWRDYDSNAEKTVINDLEAANALHALGVAPGAHVARINPRVADGWARLARVSIMAEVPRTVAPRFWTAPPDTQQALLRAFGAAGARAVVAFNSPRLQPLPPGWQRLGSTNYSVYLTAAGTRDSSGVTSQVPVSPQR